MRTAPRVAPALLAALLAGCGGGAGEGPRSALLVTLDTTRQDALSCYGGPPGLTPHLDALAAESVRYVEARTVVPLTLPSHASMLTGLYPPRTGIRNNGPLPLPASADTLPEAARAAGYRTAAFVASAALDGAFGLDQGFAVYDEATEVGPRGERERSADAVVDAALAWLADGDPSWPFLLWVHVFDPHHPYLAPAPPGGGAYHGEVAVVDAALGRLFDDLRARGLWEDLVVLVVGDHGEGLGDHGEDTHGLFTFDSTMLVPFLVRHPDGARAGEVSEEIVSVVDVDPTLREALALPLVAGVDGRSLWSEPVPEDRGVYFESYLGWASFGWSPLAGWVDRHHRYTHASTPAMEARLAAGLVEPGPDSVLAERYRAAIADLASRSALPPDGHRAVDEATLADIAALGYVTTDDWSTPHPHPLEPGDRPHPDARRDVLARFEQATAHAAAGRRADALALLEVVRTEDPANVTALDLYANLLLLEAEHERAAGVLRERLRHPPERIRTHDSLARCLDELGDAEGAALHRRRALELLVLAHERRGERDEAARYRALLEAGG